MFYSLLAQILTLVPRCTGTNLPGSNEPRCTIADLINLLYNLIRFGIFLAPLLAMGFIAWGAFLIITSQGAGRLQQGRDIIFNSLIGLAFVLGAWVIVNTAFYFIGFRPPCPWYKIPCPEYFREVRQGGFLMPVAFAEARPRLGPPEEFIRPESVLTSNRFGSGQRTSFIEEINNSQFGSFGGTPFGSTGGTGFGSAGGVPFGSTGGTGFGSTGGVPFGGVDPDDALDAIRDTLEREEFERSGGGGGVVSGQQFELPNPLGVNTLDQLLALIINGLIALAVPVVAIMAIWAAYLFITSAGDPGKIGRGRDTLIWAAVGFGLLLIARGIVFIVQQLLRGF